MWRGRGLAVSGFVGHIVLIKIYGGFDGNCSLGTRTQTLKGNKTYTHEVIEVTQNIFSFFLYVFFSSTFMDVVVSFC